METTPTTCPINGQEIFPDYGMLAMKEPGRVICPGCGRKHLWDPTKRVFTKMPVPESEKSN